MVSLVACHLGTDDLCKPNVDTAPSDAEAVCGQRPTTCADWNLTTYFTTVRVIKSRAIVNVCCALASTCFTMGAVFLWLEMCPH